MSRPVKRAITEKCMLLIFLNDLLITIYSWVFSISNSYIEVLKKYLMILLKDGLNYAEVLTEPPTSMHTRIRGIENRIMYSEIDHSLKALTGKPDTSDSGFFLYD